jgi:hypothetical protein
LVFEVEVDIVVWSCRESCDGQYRYTLNAAATKLRKRYLVSKIVFVGPSRTRGGEVVPGEQDLQGPFDSLAPLERSIDHLADETEEDLTRSCCPPASGNDS